MRTDGVEVTVAADDRMRKREERERERGKEEEEKREREERRGLFSNRHRLHFKQD